MWLACCRQAGLTMDDMARLRIDQAEALVTMSAFWADHAAHGREDAERAAAQDRFFS